jgi:hypothetical protein
LRRVAAALRELADIRYVELYQSDDGQQYYHIRNWPKHQRIDNAGKARVPPPPNLAENLGEPPRVAAGPRPRPGKDLDLDRDRASAEPETVTSSYIGPYEQYLVSEPELEQARRLLTTGYQQRYEIATGNLWTSVNRAHRDIGEVAGWAASQHHKTGQQIPELVSHVLDGFFGDDWAKEHRYPWGSLARDPARYLGKGDGMTPEVRAKLERAKAYQDAAARGKPWND